MVEKKYDNEHIIICPCCGFEDEDSWEVQSSDDDYECPSCSETFILEVEQITEYSTKRKDCKEKHTMKFNCAYVKESKYTETDIGYKDIELPQSEWEYTECYECEECSESEWTKLSKEKFIEKYPGNYERTLKHFENNLELKKLLNDVSSEVSE